MHHSSSSSTGGSSPELQNAMENAYKERINMLSSEIEDLWKKLDNLKEELAKRDEKEKDWLSKERYYEMKISTLESSKLQINDMGEELEGQYEKLTVKVAERDKTIAQKDTAIERLREEKADLEQQNSRLSTEVESLRQSLKTAEAIASKIDPLRSQLENVKSENDELKDKLALCTSAAAERDAERHMNKLLTDTCKLLQSEVSYANAILSKKTATAEQALQQVAALKTELLDQKDEMGVLVQGIRELLQKVLSREQITDSRVVSLKEERDEAERK
ncbi:hypothetical protein QR680_006956 [Steinernema hermaphroditum]|uniref:Uncharacterized protein n=1 Tax=Steinernema hermaphroditum TaxID=289476 RepID=A0AA39HZL4_9BILA|nr:hypothetical protein QR680_006956 [Steinernema hermaphroditum]